MFEEWKRKREIKKKLKEEIYQKRIKTFKNIVKKLDEEEFILFCSLLKNGVDRNLIISAFPLIMEN